MADELAVILADLDRIASWCGPDRAGLGEKALDIVADGILRNCADELDPDGNRWPELSEAYAEAKARDFPGEPIGVRSGAMLAPAEIKGLRRIVADSATMEYGTDEATRAEAAWFTEGDAGRNRPARPFYGITPEAAQQLDGLMDGRFRSAVEGH